MTFTGAGKAVAVTSIVTLTLGVVADYPELVAVGIAGGTALSAALVWLITAGKASVHRTIKPDRITEGVPVSCEVTFTISRYGHRSAFEITETIGGQFLRVGVTSLDR